MEAKTPGDDVMGGAPQQQKKLPVSVEELLARQREAMKSRIGAPSGDKIRLTREKKFRFPDGSEFAGPQKMVILDVVSYNAYFDRPWKEGEATVPACFSLSPEPVDMVPSEKSPDRQAAECNKCPMNQFGSKGDGKACGNHRLLAVVDDSDDPEVPIRLIQTSPTSIKYLDSYLGGLLARNQGPSQVVTELFFDPDIQYPTLRYGNPRPNPNEKVHAMRIEAAHERLMREPDVSGYQPPKKTKRA
jgi:hypothetical protein